MFFNRIIRLLIKHFQNYFVYYFILAFILIIGIIIGPLIVNLFDLRTKIAILRYSNPYYKIALFNDIIHDSVVKSSMFSNVFLILLILLVSFLKIGIFIVPLILLLKGFSLGFSVAFLVDNFGFKGFLLSIGGIYPQNIFLLSGLIGLGATLMSTTNFYSRPMVSSRLRYKYQNLDESLLLVGVYSSIILLGSIIEGLLSPIFLRFTLDFFI